MSRWTLEQEQAITKNGCNIIVSAGAGSGKTAVLTERTIRKLINGTDINRLLILTFTNAAAGEMKDRIRKAILKAGLTEQLDYIDSAYITTFDSFALSVVKKYHYLLNVSKSISIMDGSIEVVKTKEFVDKIFEEEYGNPDFEKLINDFCQKKDDNIKQIIIEISKKLDILPNKKEYLENYIDTHYNEEVIDQYTKEYIDKIFITLNKLKDLYIDLQCYVDNKYLDTFNLYSLLEARSYEEVKLGLLVIGSPRKNKDCDPDFKIYKDKINLVIKDLKEYTRFENISEIKESLLLTKPYVKAICDIILKLDNLFLEYKEDNNLYTFSDIALMAIKVLKEDETVRKELKESFDEIMVDEYQDTSDIQEEFINLISNNNVYMVGDIKQSIYRFRHANPYIFRDKYNNYAKEIGGIKIDLLKNFRSRGEVLDNINLIFDLIMDEEVGDADYKKDHRMQFGNLNYINDCKVSYDSNMRILTYQKNEEYSNDEIEAFTVAHDIKNKIENKYLIVDKGTNKLRPCEFRDFAVIMDRGSSFDLYKKIFEYVGVPIIQIKNEKLTMGDDIVLIRNLLSLIIKVHKKEYDNEFTHCFTSVSRSYLFRTSDEDIFDVINSKQFYNSELFKKCLQIPIFELSNLEVLNQILDIFNFYEKVITINNIQDTVIKIDYLKNISLQLSNLGYTPIMFKEYLDEMVNEESIEYSLNADSSNSVKILNIHKSKGLEYSICYFTGLSKKANEEDRKARFIVDSNYNIITPYYKDGIKQTILKDLLLFLENRESISEKIRLFYVALTRAREQIIMVTPLDLDQDGYTDIVPKDIRLDFNRISDMLQSILPVIKPYIKEIDFEKVILTHDYNNIKNYNYKTKIEKTSKQIIKQQNNISYKEVNQERYSKVIPKLINKEEYINLNKGIQLHSIFEKEDFKNTTNPYILKFIKHINLNYINCYKEYEFIYEDKHGFIDLMLEYDDYILIIDYKLKSIEDKTYIEQLNGYKKYIESITNKSIEIYLYSILEDNFKKII